MFCARQDICIYNQTASTEIFARGSIFMTYAKKVAPQAELATKDIQKNVNNSKL